jgi:hypothetical protein
MNGFSLVLLGCCVILSTPGLIVALRKSAWYGMGVNSALYVALCITVLCLPLFQHEVEYGATLPNNCQINILKFDVVGVVVIGLYWLIFQIVVMPLAVLIRRRQERGPLGPGPGSTAEGGHRE